MLDTLLRLHTSRLGSYLIKSGSQDNKNTRTRNNQYEVVFKQFGKYINVINWINEILRSLFIYITIKWKSYLFVLATEIIIGLTEHLFCLVIANLKQYKLKLFWTG